MSSIRYILFLFCFFSSITAQPSQSLQQTNESSTPWTPDDLKAPIFLLMDVTTGKILYQKNSHRSQPPASLLKVGTLNLAYKLIKEQHRSLNEIIEITAGSDEYSRPRDSSLMHLRVGDKVSLLELMKGIAVASGNDAAYALAIALTGDASFFVQKLNAYAQSRYWDGLLFADPDGYNDKNSFTAFGYAWLAREYILKNPETLQRLHSVKTLPYPQEHNAYTGQRQIYRNRNTNLLLGKTKNVDGLKTGYTDAGGFNFSATAKREGTRLLSIVMGLKPDGYYEGIRQRAEEARLLLEYGFEHYYTYTHTLKKTYEIPLVAGSAHTLKLKQPSTFSLSLPREIPKRDIQICLTVRDTLLAPIRSDQVIAKLSYSYKGQELGISQLYPDKGYYRKNGFSALFFKIKNFFSPKKSKKSCY